MKYTELKTLTEVAQAMDAGLNLEWYGVAPEEWFTVGCEGIHPSIKYRLVKEEWEPEVGEMVFVRDGPTDEFTTKPVEYRGIIDGQYICLGGFSLCPWNEVKPVPKESVAREGWVDSSAIQYSAWPTIDTDCVHVREILEGK